MKFSRSHIIAIFAAAAIVACSSDTPVEPNDSPLAGLTKSTTTGDTANTENSPVGNGPGHIEGTVMGPSQPGAGNDSLETAPRIAGVVVTIYERDMSVSEPTPKGDAKGSVTTGADGKFVLPTLPAGDYIVTFVPPASSGYYGQYVFGPLRENSGQYPWWIVLAKK
jgi:hypothetical protein